MKSTELSLALSIARSGAPLCVDDVAIFDGFALPDFRPVAARWTRWPCWCAGNACASTARLTTKRSRKSPAAPATASP